MRRRVLLLALTLPALTFPTLARAQSAPWPTTHQQALWLNASIDHARTERTSLWFDGSWRRMGLGAEPQQLLLRPGILHTIAPGIRVGAGYTYAATQPYGDLPSATPLREHRLWQDLRIASTHGALALSHRFRWEQRWIAPLVGGETADFVYQQRARAMVRAQAPLASLTYRARPVTWYAQEEVLLPVGHDGAAARFAQNRFLVGAGLPLTPRQRLDIGYQHLWNALPSRNANEVNHTLTFSWVVTSGQ